MSYSIEHEPRKDRVPVTCGMMASVVGDKVVPRLGSEDNLNVKASGVIN